MLDVDFWKFFAGLGLFLYGMSRLETALKGLAGRRFKIFLRKFTTNKFFAVLNGMVTTAVLQSSSIVMLMVIAFAGAGVISLGNSLGIVLGANLGTTFTGWIVSYFGFSLNIDAVVMPLIGIGSIGLVLWAGRQTGVYIFEFLVAFGLVFMGLGFMRVSMSEFAGVIPLTELAELGAYAFILFGFLVTAIIQSSSAVMTLTLSALNADIISLKMGALIVIGADLGTTMTAVMASLKGEAIKKRISLAHFLINVVSAVAAIVVLNPLLGLLSNVFKTENVLFALVGFHSGFNFLSIILFLPLLKPFELFLNKFFTQPHKQACAYIAGVNTNVPEAALEAIDCELKHFLNDVVEFIGAGSGYKLGPGAMDSRSRDVLKYYEHIKILEGEMLAYMSLLQQEPLAKEDSARLNAYSQSLRNGVQAAKSIKDIYHNMQEFKQSIAEDIVKFMENLHSNFEPLFRRIGDLNDLSKNTLVSEELDQLTVKVSMAQSTVDQWIYQHIREKQLEANEIATLLNVSREFASAYNFLIAAVKNYFLVKSKE